MHGNDSIKRPLLQRLVDRVGNPLEWSYVDKTLLLLGFVLLMNLPFTLFLYVTTRIPGLLPAFFNRSIYILGVRTQWAFLLLFAALFAIGLVIRRSNPENQWLAYGCAISIAIHDAWFMAGIGHSGDTLQNQHRNNFLYPYELCIAPCSFCPSRS